MQFQLSTHATIIQYIYHCENASPMHKKSNLHFRCAVTVIRSAFNASSHDCDWCLKVRYLGKDSNLGVWKFSYFCRYHLTFIFLILMKTNKIQMSVWIVSRNLTIISTQHAQMWNYSDLTLILLSSCYPVLNSQSIPKISISNVTMSIMKATMTMITTLMMPKCGQCS